MTQAHTVKLHRPKIEHFDLAALTNTDPKGFVRPVERFQVEPWGLYMGRHADHREFHYMESWLLPGLSIRVTVFHNTPDFPRDQDYYLDIGEFGQATPQLWKSVDHYLDISLRDGRGADLLDADELLAAHAAGYLGLDEAQRAVQTAAAALTGLAAHEYHLDRWLRSEGVTLTWKGST
ncbi:DUF402 domain-containing protein [Nocardia sp. alder85J]|uniref:DUF402 domain-containing protein n=1 Tax=Nocardia sp. alder85J TaxID=2862949 RepID=UPI001CD4A761|nr:DUF402 domain-containing protein [Nocardia sp. alder85J]MCX4095034.1 DUF402 domain-containing protein [Nocardia sp. alder85J]